MSDTPVWPHDHPNHSNLSIDARHLLMVILNAEQGIAAGDPPVQRWLEHEDFSMSQLYELMDAGFVKLQVIKQ